MILDHPLISQRYFFPRPGALTQTAWVDAGDAQLACYQEHPHPGAKTLLHFHGNGEIVSDYVPSLSDAFLDLGVNVFFAEYRGYGSSTGTPALTTMLQDIKPILETTGCAPEDLIVFGRSVGSIYAIEFAKQYPQIAGLVLESGIADPFERVLLRTTPEELGVTHAEYQAECDTFLNHQAKLQSYDGPLLVLHTECDGLVERSHADRNFDWAAGTQKTKRIFPQGNHNTIMGVNWTEYMNELQAFINTL